MTAITLGTAITNLIADAAERTSSEGEHAGRRPNIPVMPNSMEAGTFEDRFFKVPAKGETGKIEKAAERLLADAADLRRIVRRKERELTREERALSRLFPSTVIVLKKLLEFARNCKGRVYPSYDYLARLTSLGRATITRSLRALEDLGLIVRQRRFKRVSSAGAGPRYQQTSNVYRTRLPASLKAFRPRWMRSPVPVDAAQRQADEISQTNGMLKTLRCEDFAIATMSGEYGKAWASFGAAIDRAKREAHGDLGKLLKFIK